MSLASAVASASALASALSGQFAERGEVIEGLLAALVAGEHVLLLGPPGTAKSAITNALTGALAASKFEVLFTKYSVPEEVFGPISLQGLEADDYRRVTAGYLPSAEVAFLDEVFKANSAILNALLSILNERVFDNGGTRGRVPLEIAVGASNELPEGDLSALFDRFMVRFWVNPIASRSAMRALLTNRSEPGIVTKLSREELAELRAAAATMPIPDEIADAILDIRDALDRDHGIRVSDRRWRKAIKIVAASAVLGGRSVPSRRDLRILSAILWNTTEEIAKVRGTVTRIVSPDLHAALRIVDAATEARRSVANLSEASVAVLAPLADKLRAMLGELGRLDAAQVSDQIAIVNGYRTEIGRAMQARIG